MKKSRKAFTG